MVSSLQFGPFHDKEEVAVFNRLSERAHAIFDQRFDENRDTLTRPVHHLFVRMAYVAKSTSLAANLSNSWVLQFPALALVRVRLEQLITCSYLLHEKEEVGLKPFVSYIPIQDHRAITAAREDPELARHLLGVDMQAVEAEASRAQKELSGGISIKGGKFQRKWTKLDLRSMAKKRDSLAKSKPGLHELSLEREYLSFYKTASSVVHADASSLSFRYLDVLPIAPDKLVLMPLPSWAPIVAAAVAHYDLRQCCETLTWFGLSPESDFQPLWEEWFSGRDSLLPPAEES